MYKIFRGPYHSTENFSKFTLKYTKFYNVYFSIVSNSKRHCVQQTVYPSTLKSLNVQ